MGDRVVKPIAIRRPNGVVVRLIGDEQREEFGRLVQGAIQMRRIFPLRDGSLMRMAVPVDMPRFSA
jgi:hypothetical protein